MAEALPLEVRLRRDHQWTMFLAFLLVVTIPIAVGLWRAQEWARTAGGLLAGCMACLGTGLWIVRLINGNLDWGSGLKILLSVLFFIEAWGLLRPSARDSFAAARESIARTRVTPA